MEYERSEQGGLRRLISQLERELSDERTRNEVLSDKLMSLESDIASMHSNINTLRNPSSFIHALIYIRNITRGTEETQ